MPMVVRAVAQGIVVVIVALAMIMQVAMIVRVGMGVTMRVGVVMGVGMGVWVGMHQVAMPVHVIMIVRVLVRVGMLVVMIMRRVMRVAVVAMHGGPPSRAPCLADGAEEDATPYRRLGNRVVGSIRSHGGCGVRGVAKAPVEPLRSGRIGSAF